LNLAVISKGRPQNVSLYPKDVIWYVKEEEQEQYEGQGATTQPVKYDTIGELRNIVLEDHKGEWLVMMDDDLKKIDFVESKTKTSEITLPNALEFMVKSLKATKFLKFAGISPIAKIFYYNKPESFTNFIPGNISIIHPDNEIRYDENLRTKEDYDFTLQHIKKYGGALRCNRILATFQHYTNAGGFTDIRSLEIENESILYLMKKWGTAIRLNKKRAGEILMNVR